MLIKKENYQSKAWKNGLGVTSEIAIYPPEASLAQGNFLWRLSTAQIEKSSAFSLFPAHDRVLLVIKGQGLKMIHTFEEGEPPETAMIEKFEPYEFPGDVPSRCELTEGGITDFSIFIRTGEVQAHYQVENLNAGQEFVWNAEGKWNFIYLIEGSVQVEGLRIDEGNTLAVEQGQVSIVNQTENAMLFLVSLG